MLESAAQARFGAAWAFENTSKMLFKTYFSKILVSVTDVSVPLDSAANYSVHILVYMQGNTLDCESTAFLWLIPSLPIPDNSKHTDQQHV